MALLSLSLVHGAPDDRLAEARRILRSGDYARVASIARELVAEAEAQDSLEAGRALDLLVASLVRAGRARDPETGALAQHAVRIKEQRLGPDDPELATSLYGLAEQRRMAGEYAEACAIHERALAIRDTAGTDPRELVESLRGLGNLHYKLAEYSVARALADRALAIAEKTLDSDDPDVALALVDMGRLLRTTGDYTGGRPLLDRALAVQEKSLGPDHLESAYTLRELGEVLRLSGEYANARPVFERALAIRERVLGPDHLEVADVLTGMGVLLRRVGVTQKHAAPEAVPVCERALAIAEKTLGPDHPELAPYLEGLGWALQQQGGVRPPTFALDAQPYFERSLGIWDRTMGPGHLASADSLEGLAFCSDILHRLEASLEYRRKKVAIERAALGPDNVEVGFSLTQLAWALAAIYDSLDVARQAQHVADIKEIVETALEAERINREHARTTGRSLAESEALTVASTRWRHSLDLAIFYALRAGDADVRRMTWDAVVRSRALVLDTVASRHGAEMGATGPDLERLAAAMEMARAHLASLTVRNTGDENRQLRRDAIEDALREKERAERAFAAKSAHLAKARERSSLGLGDVMAALPPSSALVAYTKYSVDSCTSDYFAFVVRTGETAPAAVSLGSADEIERLAGDWKELLSKGPVDGASEAAARSVGENLRRKIWDPLLGHLGGAHRVFLVPDGALNAVSFAALPSGRDRYLVEDGPILHSLSSERDLVPREEPRRGEGLLTVGGPSYDAASLFAALGGHRPEPEAGAPLVASSPYRGPRSSCESFQRMRFAPLPESDKEAKRLVDIWNASHGSNPSSARRLGGVAASEAAFKSLAPGRRILHLATHGFFLGGACASALDPASSDEVAIAGIAGENPLLLSGLALAGANHRNAAGPDEEDGILTAEEIAALDLSGVEWAVLSACDTASGDVRAGEGVFGLQRAFRIAGARTLVMTLWPVDDRETRRWMEALYDGRLRRGLDTASAVREAMLAVLADRRLKGLDTHPFHWAGFLASGDWR